MFLLKKSSAPMVQLLGIAQSIDIRYCQKAYYFKENSPFYTSN